MEKLVYIDNLDIHEIVGEKDKTFSSDFYKKYVDNLESAKNSSAWKYQGQGAMFREDYNRENEQQNVRGNISSVEFGNGDDKIIYSLNVDGVSAIIEKDLTAEKDSENRIIHSNEYVFGGADYNQDKTAIATTIKTAESNFINSHLAMFDVNSNDLTTFTGGDSFDFDASFSQSEKESILFATKGVGRDSDGEFVKYSPSSICAFNVQNNELNEIKADDGYSLEKPKDDANGYLYYLKKPYGKQKLSLGRFLLNILLIPVKILMAIYYFLETFTLIFTGKTFTEKSSNPTKSRNKNARETLIDGNLVNADKEYKNNLRHRDEFAGIAPRSWQLIKLEKGSEKVIADGVIDYSVCGNEIIYTNGKNIVLIDEQGKKKKLVSTSLCQRVNA